MRQASLVAIALVLGCGGDKKPHEQQARSSAVEPGPLVAPAEPLPEVAADGTIGVAAPMRFVGAADDGSWVLSCGGPDTDLHLRVVVGDGPGLEVDRVIAATDRDLLVVDGDALVHVDAVARTRRTLGPRAMATIDADSRRIVHTDGTRLIVRDPGVAPRVVETGAPIAALWAKSKRWLEVAPGPPPRELAEGYCGYVPSYPSQYRTAELATIDLDPSGVEAVDRVGPELGITAAGEVTLDGAVVVGADCVANVIAALADPPRALVMCGKGGNRVVGAAGFVKEVGGYVAPGGEQAAIALQLTLGQRLVCVSGACIDLVTGRSFDTNSGAERVWNNERTLVRRGGGGLVVDMLDEDHQRAIVLPRVTQAVIVDTATGRRRSGPAPIAPAYIDGAGRFLLYGRYVIDTDAAQLIATLPDDALAIDRRGRVLVAASASHGPLRWKRP